MLGTPSIVIRYFLHARNSWYDILDAELIKDKFLDSHRDTSLGKFIYHS